LYLCDVSVTGILCGLIEPVCNLCTLANGTVVYCMTCAQAAELRYVVASGAKVAIGTGVKVAARLGTACIDPGMRAMVFVALCL